MAEIIKPGKYPEKNKHICEECKCEFRYYDSEVTTEFTTPDEESFLGGHGVYKYIYCPQCNTKCILHADFTEFDSFGNVMDGMKNLGAAIVNTFKRKGDKHGNSNEM